MERSYDTPEGHPEQLEHEKLGYTFGFISYRLAANCQHSLYAVTLVIYLCVNPILHTAWLANHALTLKSISAKYYCYEKSRFLHTFLKLCCE
jgi:hypothetical protein